MRTKTEITQEDLARLLGWLAPDEEEAARKYEEIRKGLIKFFHFRGCADPETLADETFNRVSIKIAAVEFDGNVKQITYFYSFASKIYLEDLTERKKIAAKSKQIASKFEKKDKLDKTNSSGAVCLEKCLAKHPPQERQILLKYYSFGKNEKTEMRKKLADEQGINLEYLHTKISRLRKTVGECVRKCLNDMKL
jgi:DNA-directed RNA polymerase specialized sigma24 family protein